MTPAEIDLVARWQSLARSYGAAVADRILLPVEQKEVA